MIMIHLQVRKTLKKRAVVRMKKTKRIAILVITTIILIITMIILIITMIILITTMIILTTTDPVITSTAIKCQKLLLMTLTHHTPTNTANRAATTMTKTITDMITTTINRT